MSKTGVAIPQLQKDLEGMEDKPRLSLAVDNIDRLIAKLTEAREAVATGVFSMIQRLDHFAR